MSNAGAPLELALRRAATHYASLGRPCFLQKQEHTPGRTNAHADLIGGLDGLVLALEAKMTEGDYFPLYPARAPQRAALSTFLRQKASVALVVEFVDLQQTYIAPWSVVETFLNAAWRRSLTVQWFRAYGQLVPMVGMERERKALWLDAAAHPDQARALSLVLAERAGKPTFPIDGDLERDAKLDARVSPKQLAVRARLASSPRPGTDEYREHLRGVVADSIGRQLGAAGRPKPGQRHQWRGGGRGGR